MNALNDRRLIKRILLVAVAFACPAAVLSWIVSSGIHARIESAKRELVGTAFLRPLMAAQKGLHDFQQATSECEASDCEPRARAARVLSDQAFAELTEAGARFAEPLELTTEGLALRGHDGIEVARLNEQWVRLKAANPEEREVQYNGLAGGLRLMLAHVADTSGLILDSDPGSFHWMDTVVNAGPKMSDRLADLDIQSRDLALGIGEAEIAVAVDAMLLEQSDYGRLAANAMAAASETQRRPKLLTALDRVDDPVKALLDLLKQHRRASPQIRALARVSRQAEFEYWNVAADELDQSLEARITACGNERIVTLVMTSLGMLAALAFAIGVLGNRSPQWHLEHPPSAVLALAREVDDAEEQRPGVRRL